jgi:hypothetical protein
MSFTVTIDRFYTGINQGKCAIAVPMTGWGSRKDYKGRKKRFTTMCRILRELAHFVRKPEKLDHLSPESWKT